MQQTNTQRQKRRACFIWDSLIVSVFAFCFVLSYSFDCNLWCSQVSQGRASCRLRPQGCLIWHIPKVSLLKSQVQAIITCRLKPSPVMTQINYCFIFKDYQYLEQCRELKKNTQCWKFIYLFIFLLMHTWMPFSLLKMTSVANSRFAIFCGKHSFGHILLNSKKLFSIANIANQR